MIKEGKNRPFTNSPGRCVGFLAGVDSDKENKRLLLFAEMKVRGEAWLEFKIMKKDNKQYLRHTATFRPKGVWGRLYWYSVLPFHYFIFNGMIDNRVKVETKL